MANPKRTSSSRRASRATIPCTRRTTSAVPDRSWRLTATGREQADCIGALAGQPAAAVRPLHGLAIRAHPRNRSHHGPAQGQMGGEPCAARTFLGRDQHHHRGQNSKTTTRATGTSKKHRSAVLASAPGRRVDCRCGRGPCAQHPDLAEPQIRFGIRGHGHPRRLHARPDAHHRGYSQNEEFLHRADSDDLGDPPTAPACTIHAASTRKPAAPRERVRWERTARPARARRETTGRWEVKVGAVARIQAPVSLQWRFGGCGAGRRFGAACWSITANSLSRKRDSAESS